MLAILILNRDLKNINSVSAQIFLLSFKFRRAFKNIYKLLRPEGKALVSFLSYHLGFEAYLRLKEDPRFQPYLQVT